MSRPAFSETASRGRVLMLVDNAVISDSRVQKQALSMAARGWDVILLGWRAKSAVLTSWEIGDAKVWLVPMPTPLSPRKHQYRSPLGRSPLAYRSAKRSAYRLQEVRAHRADLIFRIAEARANRLKPALLGFLLTLRKVEDRWVRWRADRTARVREGRAAMTAPLDRFTTWWWRTVLGDRCWRKLDPGLWDWELAYGPVIDALRPDLIHANDFRMLSVAARATSRARADGRDVVLVWDAHEYLPGIKPWFAHPRWHTAQCALERQFARHADAVVTVSQPLAELLVAEHGLDHVPAVVLNAPLPAPSSGHGDVVDIRTACGLGPDDPLLVYSGAALSQRGLDIMVEALPRMPGTHVAFVVANSRSEYVAGLVAQARGLGVSDRVHLLPYVPVEQVVPFLSTATVGVMPAHHWPNHEISLVTKFFEYSHARLPVLVSDLKVMAKTVRSTGQGEVFVAEDVDDYVAAASALIADPGRYRRAYDDEMLLASWAWETQADVLDEVYSVLRRRHDGA